MLPLLTTKLLPPRPGSVARPQLLAHLAAQPGAILLIAPAGFGKTSLLASWLRQAELSMKNEEWRMTEGTSPFSIPNSLFKTAWLTLDEADNDLARFLSYLMAALERLDPRLGDDLRPLLAAGATPTPDVAATLLLNRLVELLQQDALLVLDEYQQITNPAIHSLIQHLIERLPPPLRLVLATRHEPPFPLARWRVRGQASELRAAQLRFTPAESAQLLAPYALDAEQLAGVEAQVAGWPAGLHLLQLALQASADPAALLHGFSGRHQHVVDYLLEEVLARQPTATRAFLVQTSPLSRLSGPLCEAVCAPNGQEGAALDGQALLAELERAGLFLLPLDDERRWFRYHPLFAEALRSLLPPEQQREVHSRAARWFALLPSFDEAVQHAAMADDLALLGATVGAATRAVVGRAEAARVQAWLRLVPDAAVLADPWLAAVRAWNAIFTGRFAEAATYAAAAAPLQGDDARWLTIVRAWLALSQGQPQQALDLVTATQATEPGMFAWIAGRAQQQLGQAEAAIASLQAALHFVSAANIPLAISDISDDLCATLNSVGRRGEALLRNQDVRARLVDSRGQPLVLAAISHCRAGMLCYEANDLDEAQVLLETGYQLGDQLDHAQALLLSQLYLAQVAAARGELAAALAMLRVLRLRVGADGTPAQRLLLAATECRLLLRQGDREAAERWLAAEHPALPEQQALLAGQELRALLCLGRNDEAGRRLAVLEDDARSRQQWRTLLTLRVLSGLCQAALGDMAQAQAALREALRLAAPERYLRAFLDEDPHLLTLLPLVADQAPALVQQLTGAVAAPPALHPELLEPLRERERETLALIAEGLANREIAQRMVIELSTVKSHIKNIYAKLDVASRTQAIAKARQLGLL